MRRLAVAFVFISVAMADAAGRRVSAPETVRTFRVATFNIHKGADRQGRYDLQRTIDAIRYLDAELVGVQEVMRNHPDSNCDDQPALIAEGLRRRTGRPWTHVHAAAWITEDRRCLSSGRGSEAATEGLAFFAASPIVASDSVRLSEGRVGLVVRVAAMPHLPVIVTHLAANRENHKDRMEELALLLPWAAQYGPGFLIGDLNTQPEASELEPVMARYRDAWADAAARGRAGGVPSGSTRPGRRVSRIDYVLYDPKLDLMLQSADVVDVSSDSQFGEVSDHHPVVATFQRAPVVLSTRAAGTR